MFWTASTATTLESQQRIVDEFNAQTEDVEVTLEQIPPGEVTDSAKLISAVRGGSGPDVYLLDRFIVAKRGAAGLLQDLTGLLEDNDAEPTLSDHVEFCAAEATYQDAPYALPFDTDVRALYYNIDLLTEAGVDTEPFDGANEFQIFWQIILPQTLPALGAIAIFAGVQAWNDFLGPLIYLQDSSKYTLSIGLTFFQQQDAYDVKYNLLMAASALIVLPVVVMFLLFQRAFIEGITVGSIK